MEEELTRFVVADDGKAAQRLDSKNASDLSSQHGGIKPR
jgi:hypothetical protein